MCAVQINVYGSFMLFLSLRIDSYALLTIGYIDGHTNHFTFTQAHEVTIMLKRLECYSNGWS